MLVAALVGILAAIAIPIFTRYQADSKSAEVKTNLGSLRSHADAAILPASARR